MLNYALVSGGGRFSRQGNASQVAGGQKKFFSDKTLKPNKSGDPHSNASFSNTFNLRNAQILPVVFCSNKKIEIVFNCWSARNVKPLAFVLICSSVRLDDIIRYQIHFFRSRMTPESRCWCVE